MLQPACTAYIGGIPTAPAPLPLAHAQNIRDFPIAEPITQPTKMADAVFAGVSSDKAYVFRRSFVGKKWENVANDNKTSRVHFVKRAGNYFLKVTPEDGQTAVRKAGGRG